MKKTRLFIQILFLAVFGWVVFKKATNIWFMLFIGSLIASFLFGRIFCGWICPMNTLMGPAAWISVKLGIQKKGLPSWLQSRKWATFILGLTIALIVISKKSGVQFPFLVFFLMLSVLVTLRFEPRLWHNHICPFGVLQSLVGRFAKWSETVDFGQCIGCRRCMKVCHADAISMLDTEKKASIDPKFCHQCIQCTSVCPKDAIQYKKYRKLNESKI
ncbi:MAG: 4Fe-4S binding protein [Bacillota bacterium]